MQRHLHIVCLAVPYPVIHGGMYDLFYKLEALQQQGVQIHLHCFTKGEQQQPELNKYCVSVQYYPRRQGLAGLSLSLPYIVSSRISEQLLQDLLKDNYPVFMEGIHCTQLLNDSRLANRGMFVRLHNVEHIYYRQLYNTSTSHLKKLYYRHESKLLYNYEQQVMNKAEFWGVSEKDVEDYRAMGCNHIDFLPVFLPNWEVNGLPGKGDFCLYQGNLEIAENEKAVLWLVNHVFSKSDIPLVIAGKNPSGSLRSAVNGSANICLVKDPSAEEMQELIAKAHINVLPSFNATGIKLKLINALYNGRHCLANTAALQGSKLEELCDCADDAVAFREKLTLLYDQPFTNQQVEKRKQVLGNMFSNEANARQMVQWIWGEEDNAKGKM